MDVTSEVTKADVFALNASPASPASNLFVGDARVVLRSATDSQLLLYVPFKNTVRLSGLVLDAGGATDAPTRVKLFVNIPAMGFGDVDAEPAQELAVADADCAGGGRELKLKLTRFGRVSSLHIFLEREGADTVSLSSFRFLGSLVDATGDLAKLGKTEEGGHGHAH